MTSVNEQLQQVQEKYSHKNIVFSLSSCTFDFSDLYIFINNSYKKDMETYTISASPLLRKYIDSLTNEGERSQFVKKALDYFRETHKYLPKLPLFTFRSQLVQYAIINYINHINQPKEPKKTTLSNGMKLDLENLKTVRLE